MPDAYLTFAAFSAYTAILVALGYIVAKKRAEYRVMRMLARRGLETRMEHVKDREVQVQRLTEKMNAAAAIAKDARVQLERERAELAKAKGMSA